MAQWSRKTTRTESGETRSASAKISITRSRGSKEKRSGHRTKISSMTTVSSEEEKITRADEAEAEAEAEEKVSISRTGATTVTSRMADSKITAASNKKGEIT